MEKAFSVIRGVVSAFFALLLTVGLLLCGEPYVASGEAELTRSLAFNALDGVSFMQGLACDGEVYYGFGAVKPPHYNAITKIDVETGEILQRHDYCLPVELMRMGYCHIGDGCLYGGQLYIALEAFEYRRPAVIRYDADTLEYVGFTPLPEEGVGDGRIPWCEISDGVLYYSHSNNVNELLMLSADDMTFLGSLPLDRTLHKVQGGEVLDGKMIMTTDEGGNKMNVYAVELATGHTEVLFVRCTGRFASEGEGIAVCPTADGAQLHILDVYSFGMRIGSFKLTDAE